MLSVAGLAGCASTPPVSAPGLNKSLQTQFELDGRMAIHYRNDTSSANIHWQHRPESDVLTLSSPLGQTLSVLTRTASGVTLLDSEKQTHQAQNVSELTERLLGWQLPLENLAYWIVGHPAPDQTYQIQQDTQQGVVGLTQAGWTVTYSRWQQVDNLSMPNKLTLAGRGVEVRLVIGEWKLPKAE